MNQTVTTAARLPMPAGLIDADGIDARKWRVLCETTFPSAKTPEAIMMAFDYCRARGLDVFKKPVHIVPMWNSTLKREVETVWPGINEIQITAARTRAWAGMDEPKWGPDVNRKLKGRKRDGGNWVNAEVEVTFPEWCAVTVYRMLDGVRCAFTEPVYWIEAYSRAGGASSELPTDMWIKRPRGQLHKVAKAASLRAAFPEEGELTAEEMEGKEIEAGGVVIDHEPKSRVRDGSDGQPKSSRQAKLAGDWDITKELDAITTVADLEAWREKNAAHLAKFNGTWLASFDEEIYGPKLASLSNALPVNGEATLSETDSAALLKSLIATVGRCEAQTALRHWVRDPETKTSIRSLTETDYETFEAAYEARMSNVPE